MKVKDLIMMLNKLDQEKEIKMVVAYGYEYEEETSKNIIAEPYKYAPYSKNGDRAYGSVSDQSLHDAEKDFYLIRGIE